LGKNEKKPFFSCRTRRSTKLSHGPILSESPFCGGFGLISLAVGLRKEKYGAKSGGDFYWTLKNRVPISAGLGH